MVGIKGPVASGKSSIFSLLMNEMKPTTTYAPNPITIHGSIAYVG